MNAQTLLVLFGLCSAGFVMPPAAPGSGRQGEQDPFDLQYLSRDGRTAAATIDTDGKLAIPEGWTSEEPNEADHVRSLLAKMVAEKDPKRRSELHAKAVDAVARLRLRRLTADEIAARDRDRRHAELVAQAEARIAREDRRRRARLDVSARIRAEERALAGKPLTDAEFERIRARVAAISVRIVALDGDLAAITGKDASAEERRDKLLMEKELLEAERDAYRWGRAGSRLLDLEQHAAIREHNEYINSQYPPGNSHDARARIANAAKWHPLEVRYLFPGYVIYHTNGRDALTPGPLSRADTMWQTGLSEARKLLAATAQTDPGYKAVRHLVGKFEYAIGAMLVRRGDYEGALPHFRSCADSGWTFSPEGRDDSSPLLTRRPKDYAAGLQTVVNWMRDRKANGCYVPITAYGSTLHVYFDNPSGPRARILLNSKAILPRLYGACIAYHSGFVPPDYLRDTHLVLVSDDHYGALLGGTVQASLHEEYGGTALASRLGAMVQTDPLNPIPPHAGYLHGTVLHVIGHGLQARTLSNGYMMTPLLAEALAVAGSGEYSYGSLRGPSPPSRIFSTNFGGASDYYTAAELLWHMTDNGRNLTPVAHAVDYHNGVLEARPKSMSTFLCV